ncbi:hypothetical protein JCM5296_005887 [Sporobolomyces johnsonii]
MPLSDNKEDKKKAARLRGIATNRKRAHSSQRVMCLRNCPICLEHNMEGLVSPTTRLSHTHKAAERKGLPPLPRLRRPNRTQPSTSTAAPSAPHALPFPPATSPAEQRTDKRQRSPSRNRSSGHQHGFDGDDVDKDHLRRLPLGDRSNNYNTGRQSSKKYKRDRRPSPSLSPSRSGDRRSSNGSSAREPEPAPGSLSRTLMHGTNVAKLLKEQLPRAHCFDQKRYLAFRRRVRYSVLRVVPNPQGDTWQGLPDHLKASLKDIVREEFPEMAWFENDYPVGVAAGLYLTRHKSYLD